MIVSNCWLGTRCMTTVDTWRLCICEIRWVENTDFWIFNSWLKSVGTWEETHWHYCVSWAVAFVTLTMSSACLGCLRLTLTWVFNFIDGLRSAFVIAFDLWPQLRFQASNFVRQGGVLHYDADKQLPEHSADLTDGLSTCRVQDGSQLSLKRKRSRVSVIHSEPSLKHDKPQLPLSVSRMILEFQIMTQ